MRVIDALLEAKGLESLGYDDENLARLKKALDRPDGLVLVTGPTGSGKTTVLYSALHHLRTGHNNIISVEDPVERQVDGVNQIAVNNKSGQRVCGGAPVGPAPGSQRHHGRRDSRQRGRADRGTGGLHGPPRAELAPHLRRRVGHYPPAQSRPRALQDCRESDRGRGAAPRPQAVPSLPHGE